MASPSQTHTPTTFDLPIDAFRMAIQAHMRFKQRSLDTYTDTHFPGLTSHQSQSMGEKIENPTSIDVVFIGDSMLERLKTTGKSTSLGQFPLSNSKVTENSTTQLGESGNGTAESAFTKTENSKPSSTVFIGSLQIEPLETTEEDYTQLGLFPSLTSQTTETATSKAESMENEKFENNNNSKAFSTFLIGSSQIERLKTTKKNTHLAQLPSSFNAGVGGDKIENVLYRLDLGMMDLLHNRNIKLWVLMVGTNNLHPQKGLKPYDATRYRILLEALLRIEPQSRVLACAIFRRKDIEDWIVEKSNRRLAEVVAQVNCCFGGDGKVGYRVYFVDAPETVMKSHLVDHVHLGVEGYRLWDEYLVPKIELYTRLQQDKTRWLRDDCSSCGKRSKESSKEEGLGEVKETWLKM